MDRALNTSTRQGLSDTVQALLAERPWDECTYPREPEYGLWGRQGALPMPAEDDSAIRHANPSTRHYEDLVDTRAEAELIHHFIDELGPSLDPWDESRRFAADLVEDATSCPELMDAIIGAAAAHSLHGTLDRDPLPEWPSVKTRSKGQNEMRTNSSVALLRRTFENLSGEISFYLHVRERELNSE